MKFNFTLSLSKSNVRTGPPIQHQANCDHQKFWCNSEGLDESVEVIYITRQTVARRKLLIEEGSSIPNWEDVNNPPRTPSKFLTISPLPKIRPKGEDTTTPHKVRVNRWRINGVQQKYTRSGKGKFSDSTQGGREKSIFQWAPIFKSSRSYPN